MTDLIYPNLFYFSYDLREGLGEDLSELEKNRRIFAAKLQEESSNLFDRDTSWETEYLELLANPTKPSPKPIKEFPKSDSPYEGYYYPVRLNDTYGLLLACSLPESSEAYSVDIIAKFKATIDGKLTTPKGLLQEGTLGQTWMILAQYNPNSQKSPQAIAQECYKKLSEKWENESGFDWDRDLQGQGSFLGGNIFELWQYNLVMSAKSSNEIGRSSQNNISDIPNPVSLQDIQRSYHVIIALYPNATSAQQAAKLNFSWLRLFCYRHKILWAYGQSRYIKQQIKQDYLEIKKCIQVIKKDTFPGLNLKKLKKTLVEAQSTLSRYAIELNCLGDQVRTIEINLLNYQRRSITIQKEAEEIALKLLLPETVRSRLNSLSAQMANPELSSFLNKIVTWQYPVNFKFLENFSTDIQDKYWLQVQKDYENLSPGLQVLEDLINSIRGITEIDQAQRDRNFQTTVGVVGIGFAVGASFASISGHFPTAYNDNVIDASTDSFWSNLLNWGVPEPWLAPFISASISLGVALGIITIITVLWMGLKLCRKIVWIVVDRLRRFFKNN